MRSTRSPSSTRPFTRPLARPITRTAGFASRLLGFDPVPVPPHVFALDRRHLRYGQFARAGQGFRFRAYRAVELPADAFASGPLGGPLRDPQAFQALLGTLLRDIPRGAGPRDASLVIPDAWLRVAFTEIGDLPRSAEARDEVLRWKLKRLVPFRVDELRVDAAQVTPLPGQEEPGRLLLGFAVEQLLAQLEDAFAAHRVRLGQITNASLALVAALAPDGRGHRAAEAGGLGGAFTALVLLEEAGYTLAFVCEGEPVLHRFKGFTTSLPESARAGFVARDLKLTRNFLDEHFPGATLARVLLSAPPELEPAWLARLAEGLGQEAAPLDGRHLPAVQREGPALDPAGGAASWRDLAPMLGAARREVA